MKYRVLLALIVLSVAGTSAVGCGTPTPPVDKVKHLKELVLVGQTLDQVKALMTDRLQQAITIYPAKKIERDASGGWRFTAKEGLHPGDTDAPYLALIVPPDRQGGDDYYTIFFKDGAMTASETLSYTGVQIIRGTFAILEELE